MSGPDLLQLALIVAFLAAMAPFHELAHALAGRALGLSVLEVSVGQGPTLWEREGRRTALALHALPLGGRTRLVPRSERLARSRIFLATLAGPAVHALALALALLLAPSPGAEWLRGSPAGAFAFANAVMLATSLVAYRARFGRCWRRSR